MTDKLSQIIENKNREVAEKKKSRDFLGSIERPKMGDIAIIAEIKMASPSAGKLGDKNQIKEKAIIYEKSFADAISVVVDKKYFGGDLRFITIVKSVVSLPILAKDFVIDPYQIYEMKAYGADAILLIAKILSEEQLIEFVRLSLDLGLEPVVEVQDEEELKMAQTTATRIIAVNARNLMTFKVDIDNACSLIRAVPDKFISLGFSGVSEKNDIQKYKDAGAKGVLVGTSLMRAKNAGQLIADLKTMPRREISKRNVIEGRLKNNFLKKKYSKFFYGV